MTYQVLVVEPANYEAAVRIAEEKAKDRQKLGQQRLLIKRIFQTYFKQTFAFSGSIRASITINDQKALASERLTAIYQDMEEELRRVKDENEHRALRQSALEVLLADEKADSLQLAENWEVIQYFLLIYI